MKLKKRGNARTTGNLSSDEETLCAIIARVLERLMAQAMSTENRG